MSLYANSLTKLSPEGNFSGIVFQMNILYSQSLPPQRALHEVVCYVAILKARVTGLLLLSSWILLEVLPGFSYPCRNTRDLLCTRVSCCLQLAPASFSGLFLGMKTTLPNWRELKISLILFRPLSKVWNAMATPLELWFLLSRSCGIRLHLKTLLTEFFPFCLLQFPYWLILGMCHLTKTESQMLDPVETNLR